MKYILKIITFFIIVCLFCSSVYGQDKIKMNILITPCSWIPFENYFGIETPTIGQKFKLRIETRYNDTPVEYVKITNISDFKLESGPEIELDPSGSKTYVYVLTAPQKEGVYKIQFESRVKEEKVISYDTDIKVVEDDPKQNWIRFGIFSVFGIVIVGILLVAGNVNR